MVMATPVKALFFDVFGTLADWRSGIAREAERLLTMQENERSAAFHVLWTLKEARGKRSGEGLLPEQSRRIATSSS